MNIWKLKTCLKLVIRNVDTERYFYITGPCKVKIELFLNGHTWTF